MDPFVRPRLVLGHILTMDAAGSVAGGLAAAAVRRTVVGGRVMHDAAA
ncbi:hypothetical protein [Microbacterium sp. 18062]|nr:hypothetical protein [Microbacterium sp. 18062]